MSNMLDKTIFLGIRDGFAARYLLRTAIFPTLKKSGARIVILTPNPHEEYFVQEFKDDNVFIEKLETERWYRYYQRSRIQRLFRQIREGVMGEGFKNQTMRDKATSFLMTYPNPIKRPMLSLLVKFLWYSHLARDSFLALENRLLTVHLHKEIFDRYKPDVVVAASPGFRLYDTVLLREAKSRGIKTVGTVISWDHTSSEGLAGVKPDYVVAWSDVQRRELIEGQDLRSEQVFVGGVPTFDHYCYPEKLPSKEQFFQKFDLDPQRKLIFITTTMIRNFSNAAVVETIAKAIASERLCHPSQIVVRVHPGYFSPESARRKYLSQDLQQLHQLECIYPYVKVNIPNIISRDMGLDMSPSEMEDLACLLTHSDVVVTVVSTINLEASICGTPVVTVGYQTGEAYSGSADGAHKDWYFYMGKVVYRTHNQRAFRNGGVKLVLNEEQLIQEADAYLEDPSKDQEGRRHLVEQECGSTDGRSGERVGQYILSLLS